MKYYSKFRGIALTRKVSAILITLALIVSTLYIHTPAVRASGYSLVILSNYRKSLKIGQSYPLIAISNSQKKITWKSSSSRIASVNTYGLVTAKKAGTCKITAKVTGGEASCQITVCKTTITLSAATITMENGAAFQIKGKTSNDSAITWKSSRSSIAAIDENGNIVARKIGEATITASADGTKKTCKVTVKKPKVTLSKSKISLYRTQNYRLSARVSSGRTVTWKSKKSSVATVDENGTVTAKKHGTTIITAKVDGVTKECEVTVQPPTIRLSTTSTTLTKGKSITLEAKVSSGLSPVWSSSRSSVATVNKNGVVTAVKKGSCYIHATEDGTKVSCHITVTD